jgi:hypothetical protein
MTFVSVEFFPSGGQKNVSNFDKSYLVHYATHGRNPIPTAIPRFSTLTNQIGSSKSRPERRPYWIPRWLPPLVKLGIFVYMHVSKKNHDMKDQFQRRNKNVSATSLGAVMSWWRVILNSKMVVENCKFPLPEGWLVKFNHPYYARLLAGSTFTLDDSSFQGLPYLEHNINLHTRRVPEWLRLNVCKKYRNV